MKDFDLTDIILILLALSISISLCVFAINEAKISSEKSCVDFYKKNNYILESCEIYREKLEG